MERILTLIKKCIPTALFVKVQPAYHYLLNFVAALSYGFPSRKLIVVGVTGTTGKTTTVYMIAKILAHAGMKVGYTSTAMFGDGSKEWLNDKKMTMVGRFFTQQMLRKMVTNGCRVAIVETTSEGALQFRHRFINYDVFLFTGIYPEHIEAHGGFENYKNAKLSLFRHLERCVPKKNVTIPKTIIVNGDDENAHDFLNFDVSQKILFTQHEDVCHAHTKVSQRTTVVVQNDCVLYHYQQTNAQGVQMVFDKNKVQLQLLGDFTATNATAAGCVARVVGLDDDAIRDGFESIVGIPGRLEKIKNTLGATIIVDYAFEPVAVTKLYETVALLMPHTIIHVLGSAGGGRDVARRDALGQLAGARADKVIVTNEDPYDDDPREIMEMVAGGARSKGKEDGKNLFVIEDRREAIQKALSLATHGSVVLITGKGSEQAIVERDNQRLPWDDRKVVREILENEYTCEA